MRVRRIRLKNVCRHKELDWQLKPGVIGLLGPNGAGKSTALNAVYAALTNDYSRFEKGKKGVIRQQAAEDAESFIKVEVEHLGHVYGITRSLRPDKHKFEVLGSEAAPLTKATEISVAIEEHLGITRSLLDNYVFVAQWDMFAFLSLTEAERAKHFARLCGTTGAELCWVQLGKQLDLDRGLVVEVVDTTDAIQQELSASSRRRSKLLEKKTRTEKRQLSTDEVTALQEVGPKRQRFIKARQELSQVQQREEELLAAARKANTAVKQGEEVLQKTQIAVRQVQDAAEAQADELAELRNSLKSFKERQRLARELAEIKKKARAAPVWPRDLAGLDAGEVQDKAAVAANDLVDASCLIEQCGGKGVVECPTCGTSTTAGSLQRKLREVKERFLSLQTADKEAYDLLSQLREFAKVEQGYAVWKAGYDSDVGRLSDRLQQMPAVDVDRVKKRTEELNVTVTRRNDCRSVARTADEAMPELRRKKQEAILEHVQAKQKKQQIETTIATCEVSKKTVENAISALNEHQEAVETAAYVKAQINEIERNQRAANKRLREMREAVKWAQRSRKWITFLESARAVLRRDRLPAEVHKAVLSEMEQGINADLDDFGSPFYVRSNESLSFTAFFQDGVVMPAGGLSGGEKVTLALPFRLQVNSMFAAQVGMLVLDEPTAGLDAEHIESVIEVFNRLRGAAKARGFQIIVVTHERELERAFDQVFDVGSSE